jgi:branched-chain amino acid transport system ATP-binding protein
VPEGELHALIGPNGAGKTTLLAQVFGELRPNAGTIELQGEDVSRLPVHRRVLLGMARTFQITQLLPEYSVRDHLIMSIQAQHGTGFRFFGNARRERKVFERTEQNLQEFGLAAIADKPVNALSQGERKEVELAMALSAKPRLLLLDEPMAGLGAGEGLRMIETLRRIKGTTTIVLVEHDMEAVFSLADRVSVLLYGKVIATGSPEEIRENADVRMAYVGDGSA